MYESAPIVDLDISTTFIYRYSYSYLPSQFITPLKLLIMLMIDRLNEQGPTPVDVIFLDTVSQQIDYICHHVVVHLP